MAQAVLSGFWSVQLECGLPSHKHHTTSMGRDRSAFEPPIRDVTQARVRSLPARAASGARAIDPARRKSPSEDFECIVHLVRQEDRVWPAQVNIDCADFEAGKRLAAYFAAITVEPDLD